jgi:hypothetical protein
LFSLFLSLTCDDSWFTGFNSLKGFVEGFEMKRMVIIFIEMKVRGEWNQGEKF